MDEWMDEWMDGWMDGWMTEDEDCGGWRVEGGGWRTAEMGVGGGRREGGREGGREGWMDGWMEGGRNEIRVETGSFPRHAVHNLAASMVEKNE
jgi:hypothetical protein